MSKFHLGIFLLLCVISCKCLAQSNQDERINTYTIEKQFISTKDGLASREVYCVAQDQNGFIWFGTKFGLNRYDGKNIILFTTKDGLSSNIISNLFVDGENRLIIQHGLRWSPTSPSGKTDIFDVNTFKIIPYNKTTSSFKNINKNNWIYHYIDKDIIYKIEWVSGNDSINKKLRIEENSRIYVMPENKAKLIYSKKDGIYYIEGELSIKLLNSSDLFEGDEGRINYFFKDALGNLWICMSQGVYKIKYKKNHFYSYFTNAQQNLYPWPQARGIYVDIDNNGQKTVFANVMASMLSSKKNLEQTLFAPAWAIIGIKNNLYAFGSGLFEFDKVTLNRIRRVNEVTSEKVFSTCVFQYSDSILYVGTSQSIFAYNRFNQKKWLLQKSSNKIPAVKNVYRIVKTSKGITAVAENGIYIIQNEKISNYFGPLSKDENKYLPISSILDIHEDKNNCLWIASNGDGLIQWDWNKNSDLKKTRLYTMNDGLPSMTLYRIEEDDVNNLWVSTDDGIMKFNKKNKQITLYKNEDGLPHHEFNRTSSFKSKDGWLYFGGMNGVVGFDPDSFMLKNEQKNVPLHIINIKKYSKNKEINIPWLANNSNEKIIWRPEDKFIKIEFALLDYQIWKKQYAYKINGIQDEWIYTNDNSITIGSLPYGSYIMEIKAQLRDGTWQDNAIKLPIEAVPPIYLQTWVIILSCLLILIGIIAFIKFRTRKLLKDKDFLEKSIAKRTEQLNILLKEKEVHLKEIHHRVKNNLQIISGLLEIQNKKTSANESALLNESINQIHSIALIHKNLYEFENMSQIDLKTFVNDLYKQIENTLLRGEKSVEVTITIAEKINLDVDTAIPLGLILNELVTNSCKYASINNPNLLILITIQLIRKGHYQLQYYDNGPGLPATFNLNKPTSMGMQLIKDLTRQIKGTITYENKNGAFFMIHFTNIDERKKQD